jgi:type IV secretion/conjugal transfer VirB4 family ATPase
MRSLAPMRSRRQSLADNLPWSHLADDGLVVTKGGQFLAGYYFRPPDSASSTDEEASLICDRMNEALTRFGDGWASWTDVVSFRSGPYPPESASHFPDPVSRMIDEERRRNFEREGAHYENDRAFFLCYTPPLRQVSKLQSLMYDDPRKGEVTPMARLQAGFGRALEQLEDQIARTLGMRRMRGFAVEDGAGVRFLQDELVNYLNFATTGKNHGVIIPASGAYLDSLIGGQDAWPGENPIIGNDYVGVVTIDGFPAEGGPNVISVLNTMGMPYRFTQRFIFMDVPQAVKELGRYKKNWKQKARGIIDVMINGKSNPDGDGDTDSHAHDMSRDASEAVSLAESGAVKFGWYSPGVVLRNPRQDDLADMLREVEKAINDCGFGARIEATNTMEAWRGALPGDVDSNVRRPPMQTAALSVLLPLSGVWTGHSSAPCPLYPQPSPPLLYAATIGRIPFRLNLHVSDVGHTLIFGPTGAGKSTLTNLVAIQARRYPDMRIWSFDYKRGMMPVAAACGGRHYDIGGDSDSPAFCPLAEIDKPGDREFSEDYLEVLYELQTGVRPPQPTRSEIHLAMGRIGVEGNSHRSMTDFVMALQDREARDVFEYYTMQGNGGRLLDGREDGIRDSDFSVFETQNLIEAGVRLSAPTLLHLFRRFERSLDGRPSILFIAEAWQAFASDIWVSRLQRWLRVMRSKNCSVVMDTQSLADSVNTKLLPLLVESCPTKIFLPNPGAFKTGTTSNPGPYDLYKTFGLNDNQISIIAEAEQKRHYYVTSPEGCRLIDLGLGPLAMSIVGATSEADVNEVSALVERYRSDWFAEYLEQKGLAHLAREYGSPWPNQRRRVLA